MTGVESSSFNNASVPPAGAWGLARFATRRMGVGRGLPPPGGLGCAGGHWFVCCAVARIVVLPVGLTPVLKFVEACVLCGRGSWGFGRGSWGWRLGLC